jgi:hypothetical protein
VLGTRTKWLDPIRDAKMFKPFMDWVEEHKVGLQHLREGYTLWGEMVNNHNILKYKTTCPFVLFDISFTDATGDRHFIAPAEYAIMLNEDCFHFVTKEITWTQLFAHRDMPRSGLYSLLDGFLGKESVLGGRIEGVVLKNYEQFSAYGSPLFGKYVAPEFKETKPCKVNDPSELEIANAVYTEMRVEKGIETLKEKGIYTGSVEDIGPLIGYVSKDVHVECEEHIKNILFKKHWRYIQKLGANSIARRYKEIIARGVSNEDSKGQEGREELSREDTKVL